MSIPLAYIREKEWYDRARPTYKCFERHDQPRIEELELHKEVFGMSAYRQEVREISFLRHIARSTNRKVRNTTVDKIIANRARFEESESLFLDPAIDTNPFSSRARFENNKTMRDLIVAHGLSILKLDLPPEKLDMKRLYIEAANHFERKRQESASHEEPA